MRNIVQTTTPRLSDLSQPALLDSTPPTLSDYASLSAPQRATPGIFDYLKEIRQILHRDDAQATPFGFHVLHHGYHAAANGGLEGMVQKGYELLSKFGASAIAHHAWHLADAATNLLLSTPRAQLALSGERTPGEEIGLCVLLSSVV